MEVKRFFADTSPDCGVFTLDGDELYHMRKVLRYKVGYKAIICNGDGNEYDCTVTEITDDCAVLKVDNVHECAGEPDFNLRLCQAIPKSAKYEYIIQKSVELGVSEIIFFDSDYSSSEEYRQERADKIALEACKQCGRARRVRVSRLSSLDEVLDRAQGMSVIMPYEKADGASIACAAGVKGDIALIIGSEGGFSDREARLAIDRGAMLVTLGKRILRCETAAAVATALVMYERGGLGK
ncbi:MAG: 16S rRNA (uracil(1498)-N(3))-methyltransferase [Clostridia bacterium]|nr:16S rRNA (uracil(1498)-N(3))-methyltransferase [Clostridia bacterium]